MKKPNLNIEYWFPTPIWNYRFNNVSGHEFNEAIQYCYEVRKKTPGRVLSNVGGWQSNDLHYKDIVETPLLPFFNEIAPLFDELTAEIASPRTLRFDNAWININKKGNRNALHTHPSSFFSGVFYLTEMNSKVKFVKNYDVSNWWKECLQSTSSTLSTFNEVVFTPKAGDLLLFPSWLQHSVDDNEYDNERISVAFNIT